MLFTLPACTKDNNSENNNSSGNESGGNNSDENEEHSYSPWEDYTPTSKDIELTNKLLNTTWMFEKHVENGMIIASAQDYDIYDYHFLKLSYRDGHYIYIDGQKWGYWWFQYGKFYQVFGVDLDIEDYYGIGFCKACHSCAWDVDNDKGMTVTKLTNSEFVHSYLSYDNEFLYYTRSSDGGGGGGSSYEAPDVGFYDYESALHSLIVKFKIYNNSEAQVSSAKVYYGTSSNPTSKVNATISGSIITAYITGLVSGTKYYVKCEATGLGGTTTTPVSPCMTLYP